MQVENVECQIAQAQISRYLAGDPLPEETLTELEGHLSTCDSCRELVNERKASLQMLLGDSPEPAEPVKKSKSKKAAKPVDEPEELTEVDESGEPLANEAPVELELVQNDLAEKLATAVNTIEEPVEEPLPDIPSMPELPELAPLDEPTPEPEPVAVAFAPKVEDPAPGELGEAKPKRRLKIALPKLPALKLLNKLKALMQFRKTGKAPIEEPALPAEPAEPAEPADENAVVVEPALKARPWKPLAYSGGLAIVLIGMSVFAKNPSLIFGKKAMSSKMANKELPAEANQKKEPAPPEKKDASDKKAEGKVSEGKKEPPTEPEADKTEEAKKGPDEVVQKRLPDSNEMLVANSKGVETHPMDATKKSPDHEERPEPTKPVEKPKADKAVMNEPRPKKPADAKPKKPEKSGFVVAKAQKSKPKPTIVKKARAFRKAAKRKPVVRTARPRYGSVKVYDQNGKPISK